MLGLLLWMLYFINFSNKNVLRITVF
jgi:hypothetical protein